jgi:hypothetical protein
LECTSAALFEAVFFGSGEVSEKVLSSGLGFGEFCPGRCFVVLLVASCTGQIGNSRGFMNKQSNDISILVPASIFFVIMIFLGVGSMYDSTYRSISSDVEHELKMEAARRESAIDSIELDTSRFDLDQAQLKHKQSELDIDLEKLEREHAALQFKVEQQDKALRCLLVAADRSLCKL